ncbi:MAG: cysteine desulfurase [Candidatus Pacearchaeota archaeon]|nr:cysteine desulfurase [Candidatus Pacearchaeota archaeon]
MGKEKNVIYLDNSATTKTDEKVVEEMKKYFVEEYGNPSSLHEVGERARKAIDFAREKIAKSINAKSYEIYFTSGGTEDNNIAIQGIINANKNKDKNKIITTKIEHPSITKVCEEMKARGYEIIEIGVNKEGIINLEELEKKIDDKTLLVSIMHVNNEIGTIQPIEEIGKICKEKEVLFHSDAVQSFGKLDIDIRKMNVDLLSSSGHKINGPKGIGFLFVREGVNIKPIVYGGQQERGLRSGTENVPGIMGFAKACEIISGTNKEKIKKLRDKLMFGLEKIGGKINGSKEKRIYNNINVSFSGIDSEMLVLFLSKERIMVSTGSACESKKKEENRVLKAIGLNEKEARGTIRIVLGKETSEKDIDYALKKIEDGVKRLK